MAEHVSHASENLQTAVLFVIPSHDAKQWMDGMQKELFDVRPHTKNLSSAFISINCEWIFGTLTLSHI